MFGLIRENNMLKYSAGTRIYSAALKGFTLLLLVNISCHSAKKSVVDNAFAPKTTHGDLTRKNCCGKLVTGVVNWKIDPLPMTFE
jgi:hypothetical protein